MRRKLTMPLKSLAIALGCVACIISQVWGQEAERLTEGHKVMLGAFMAEIQGRGAKQQNNEANLEGWEAKIGHPLAFQLSYYGPANLTAEKLAADPMIQGDLRYHRVPYISYRCETALENYINGSQDALLDQTASALKSLQMDGKPVPVLFRPFHEFNLCLHGAANCANNDNPSCFTATTIQSEQKQFIQYWEHLYRRIVVFDGATNVLFVWSPSTGGGSRISLAQIAGFMPPVQYLSFIGFDAYDRGAQNGLVATVKPAYDTFAPYGVKMIWTETAEDSSDCVKSQWTQARYFTDLADNISQFSLLHGFGYFESWPQYPNCQSDWILDQSGGEAFIRLARQRKFQSPTY